MSERKSAAGRVAGIVAVVLLTGSLVWMGNRRGLSRQQRFTQALKEPWTANPKYLLPMFGSGKKTEDEAQSDRRFVEIAVKGSGSSELAAIELSRMGWDAYRKKDYKLAMSRFNQAWLVDPNQGEAYWGFGLMTGLDEKIDDSIGLLRKAAELVPQSPKKARLFCDLAYAYSVKGDPVEPAAEREKIYVQAAKYYEAAEVSDPNLALTQSHWAMLLFKREKFKESWERASRARTLGGEGLDPDFAKAVEAQMKKSLAQK